MTNTLVPNDWTSRLSSAIAGALREFSSRVKSEPLVMLAIDCHPWHGSIVLAALTAAEVADEGFRADPAEMASWQYFDFAADLPSWAATSELGRFMKSAYETGDRTAVADAFMQACATAITSEAIRHSLEDFVFADGFRLSAAHPDDGREFVASDGWPGITNGGS